MTKDESISGSLVDIHKRAVENAAFVFGIHEHGNRSSFMIANGIEKVYTELLKKFVFEKHEKVCKENMKKGLTNKNETGRMLNVPVAEGMRILNCNVCGDCELCK